MLLQCCAQHLSSMSDDHQRLDPSLSLSLSFFLFFLSMVLLYCPKSCVCHALFFFPLTKGYRPGKWYSTIRYGRENVEEKEKKQTQKRNDKGTQHVLFQDWIMYGCAVEKKNGEWKRKKCRTLSTVKTSREKSISRRTVTRGAELSRLEKRTKHKLVITTVLHWFYTKKKKVHGQLSAIFSALAVIRLRVEIFFFYFRPCSLFSRWFRVSFLRSLFNFLALFESCFSFSFYDTISRYYPSFSFTENRGSRGECLFFSNSLSFGQLLAARIGGK